MTFRAEVVVQLKPVVNDPQGIVVRESLLRLGFDGVRSARVGKHIALEIDAADEASARESVQRMCEQLLRNPVIEDYRVESLSAAAEPASAL
ncbi:MAG: phosphoribosylformylglycinamidine synthase subunit PurS [Candidatus Dormibacteraeota bacterium]|nr:phosphoribosylformylglycinamidine synthase subunit PurS [Candidatus Dormibacteraeota bacterium]